MKVLNARTVRTTGLDTKGGVGWLGSDAKRKKGPAYRSSEGDGGQEARRFAERRIRTGSGFGAVRVSLLAGTVSGA